MQHRPGVAARGYVEGKRTAEDAVRKTFPQTGVILRPWAIYGQRQVTSSVSVPLQLIFKPLESALSLLPGRRRLADTPLVGSLLLPPVSVDAVARAAVAAATDPSVPGGVLDVWDIQARYGN